MIKKILVGIGLLAMVGFLAAPALADEDTVEATVEPKLIAVSVEDGAVDYGALDLSESAAIPNTEDTANLNDTQTVTNDSNVSVKVNVKSSDAVGGTNWDLVASGSIALNAYGHQYNIDSGGFVDFPTNNDYVADVVTLDKSGGADYTADLDLKIFMPTSSTDTAGAKTITVTVLVHE